MKTQNEFLESDFCKISQTASQQDGVCDDRLARTMDERSDSKNQSAYQDQTRSANQRRFRNFQNRYRSFVIFGSLAVLSGVMLRIWSIDRVPGINGDEAWYGVQAQQFVDRYFYGKELPANEAITFRTPTGNIWNPFFMIPRIMLESFGEPSFFKLRFPAIVFGILTLWINFRFCRRAISRQSAWTTTIILAVLPTMIAYNRIAWDACQSVLFLLPTLYWPIMARRTGKSPIRATILSEIMLGCAVIVHPTNIFTAPIWFCLVFPLIQQKIPFCRESLQRHSGKILSGAIGCMLVIAFFKGWHSQPQLDFSGYARATLHPQSMFAFLNDALRLFTGEQIFYSMSLGEPIGLAAWIAKIVSLVVVMPMIFLTLRMIYREFRSGYEKSTWDQSTTISSIVRSLTIGLITGTICFLLLGGPEVIHIGYERYGLWLIAPCTLLAGLAMQRRNIIPRSTPTKPFVTWIKIARTQAIILLIAFLILFHFHIELTGGTGHATYMTASTEPKEEKLADDIRKLGHIKLDNISANETWWQYWPIRYLSRSSVTIMLPDGKVFDPKHGITEMQDISACGD